MNWSVPGTFQNLNNDGGFFRRCRSGGDFGPRAHTLFVHAAWAVLVKVGPERWQRYEPKSWIETAKQRLHRNVLANRAR